ncbi:transposition, RNA-mediated [Rhizoctonia solani]|uniref:Transposition, RNA-mediated n=1 Tax=Rhizoctonia solani TaxID=456999 RepID=A0A8H7I6C8_9AGAM|nr:transposition, RNA-mediated [Rhizoctonia solani]
MRTNPSTVTTWFIQAINALTLSSGNGVQTHSWNLNAPALSLARERGGVKTSINNTTPSSQSMSNILNKVTNLAVELKDISASSSDTNSSKSNDHCIFSLLTNTSVLSAPTILSKLAFALDALPTLQSNTSIDTRFPLGNNQASGTILDCVGQSIQPKQPPHHGGGPCRTTGKQMVAGNAKGGQHTQEAGNGKPECHKAHLAAQGINQQPSIDFDKTFALVVPLDFICSLASLANNNNWDICQLDINATYLHAEVDKELYMQQIPYFEDGTYCVLKLKHSFYGLKPAGHK